MEIYHATLLIALAMIAIEVMTTTFYFLGIAAGFLVVAVVQFLTGNLEIGRDAIVFCVAAVLATVVLRRTFKHSQDTAVNKHDVNRY